MKVSRRILWQLPNALFLLFLFTPSFAFAQSRVGARSELPTTTSCLQIPANTDVMKLSDAELAAYGFPSHASIQANPTLWAGFAKHTYRSCQQGYPSQHYAHRSFPHANTSSVKPNSIGDGCSPVTPGVQCQDGIWAGNIAVGRGRGGYKIASMIVRVPSINTSDSSAEVAFWAGVGGEGHVTNGLVLVQSAIVVSVVNGRENVETDIEVANNVRPYTLPLCRSVAVNDTVYLYAESNVNNDGYDYFFIRDNNLNCSNSCYVGTNNSNPPQPHCPFTGGPSFNSDSATGECIAERVNGTEFGTGSPVAEFNAPGHQDQITSCDVNNTEIGSQSHFYEVVVNGVGGGQLLIGVGAITNFHDFNFEWHQSS